MPPVGVDGLVDALGDWDGVLLGVGLFVTVPEHVTPLSVNVAGDGLLPVHVPLNPMLVDAPVASAPL